MKNQIISIALILFTGLLSSCNDDPVADLSSEESLVYYTNRDKSVDFIQYKTFSVADSILVIQNNRQGYSLTSIDKDMLEGIIANMKALGYTYVGPNDNPDLGLTASWISDTYLNVASIPISSYWGYGGYGYGYGYPSYYQYYQTQENYWLVNMLDFKNADTTKKSFPVVWNAQIKGNDIENPLLINTMVDALFSQSPYLKQN
ncbi:uncharacterized protein DUF4136 [Dyadobacter jejuensis]|uniref:Uncharacterized protein DUF4136 n=1 Tax=Dyadobacter jejuensis TaxID=1082580 RepID=A0A316AQ71_9BACT|nr:DUF4136 domain-containing protein [Dyadobacter jejuensis]PWJ59284.1 uncharacterized protein DUF4136 [Dyadobacter jejuensis]